MNKTIAQINSYLQVQGWTGLLVDSSSAEQMQWNDRENNEEAFQWFKEHRAALFNIERTEFQARTSAMSNQGANAYADNWN